MSAEQRQAEKRAIRHAFGRAASAYDSVARVQRDVANTLLASLPSVSGLALDAGAGTGYLARGLREHGLGCIALDHAAPMLSGQDNAVCGDLEALPIASGAFDLYCSSLAWQWTSPALAIAEAARSLRLGGWLHVATLGPRTLHELRSAWGAADSLDHVRSFDPPELYLPLLQSAGFANIRIKRQAFKAHATSLRQGLRELRTLGAHVVGGKRPRGLSGLRGFRTAEAYYERLRDAGGLPFTYDVLFLQARRDHAPAI